jgi:hypothetical protein
MAPRSARTTPPNEFFAEAPVPRWREFAKVPQDVFDAKVESEDPPNWRPRAAALGEAKKVNANASDQEHLCIVATSRIIP